jgi:hypothetical protein
VWRKFGGKKKKVPTWSKKHGQKTRYLSHMQGAYKSSVPWSSRTHLQGLLLWSIQIKCALVVKDTFARATVIGITTGRYMV